jgi:hypothetical protein
MIYTPQEIVAMLHAAKTTPQLLVVLYQLQLAGMDVQPDIDRILARTKLTIFELDKLHIYARSLYRYKKVKTKNY